MFVDKAGVKFLAGDGGDGIVSFRHEKFVDRGGPDGGDGGDGGDVILIGSRNQNTLATFRYQKLLKAQSGNPGESAKKHGKRGESLKILVPLGTVFVNVNGEIVAEILGDGEEFVIAKGGSGGYGNAHFVSSVRQAPKLAEKGEKGELVEGNLELKIIADVGLVGLPNAGKSTLLSVISNAKPAVANYPFTTLRPNLGVVDINESSSILFADIPGLIEGASSGKGLGDEFLRHIERTSVLVHIIDIYNSDIVNSYKTIQTELAAYKVNLSKKPQIIVINKIEGLSKIEIDKKIAALKKAVPKTTKILAISAQAKIGLDELKFTVFNILNNQKTKEIQNKTNKIAVIKLKPDVAAWTIKKSGKNFIVRGKKIEKFAARTNFDNDQAVDRLRDIMKKMGIMRELKRQNVDPGIKIKIANINFIEY